MDWIYNLQSLLGIALLLGLAWLLSTDRRVVNWRLLGAGLGLQLLFGLVIFRTGLGQWLFDAVQHGATWLLAPAGKGTHFVFGTLSVGPGETGPFGESSLGFIFATQTLPPILYVSALMAILNYVGVLPAIIRGFAWLFTRLFRTSGAESLAAAGNIVFGVESTTAVQPYIKEMTRSELCTLLTVGMATVAANVLSAYIMALGGSFPTIAAHLVSASFLSAPAALMTSKLLLPETETPITLGASARFHHERPDSLFEAVLDGAQAGLKLALGIAALLVAVLGLVALLDQILGLLPWFSEESLPGWLWWLPAEKLSVAGILRIPALPLAWMMGVPLEDVEGVAELLGIRAVETEFAAYPKLSAMLVDGSIRNPRSAVVAAYGLCGFAHVASMAIFVGGAAALAPERKRDLAAVAWRALLAATLACVMTGAVAGLFYHEEIGTPLRLGAPAPVPAPTPPPAEAPPTAASTNSDPAAVDPEAAGTLPAGTATDRAAEPGEQP